MRWIAASSILWTGIFASGMSLAQDGPAVMQAEERARSELVAGLELVNEPLELALPEHARPLDGDRIGRRLDVVFALVERSASGAVARLPRLRPIQPEALAYAAPAERQTRRASGQSAIEDLVAQHAEANNVPAELAQALVQVESGFNPKARGRNGEIGLLQIKPQTARAMGYKGSAKGLYDANTNLAFGMKYLAEAHQRADGDTCGTLLRFNSGLDARRASKGSGKFCAKVKNVMAKRA